MVDDSAQQPVQDSVQAPSTPSIPSVPESPSDQSAAIPPRDVGQIPPNWPSEIQATSSAEVKSPPETIALPDMPTIVSSPQESNWPNTPNMANVQSDSANSPQTVANDEKLSEISFTPEPLKEEVSPLTTTPEIGQVEEKKVEASPSASLIIEPIPAVSAQLEEKPSEPIPTERTQAESKPVKEAPPPEPVTQETVSANLANQPSGTSQPSESQSEKPAESTLQQVNTDVHPPDNQANQVQSAPSDTASKDTTEQKQEELANFTPEPLEQPQEAPIAPIEPPRSAQKSFGDLLEDEIQSPSNPSTPSIPPNPLDSSNSPLNSPTPQPTLPVSHSISFGDLIKDIEYTPPVLPEAHRQVETPQTQSTQISTPSQPAPTPQQPQTPLSPPEQIVIKKPAVPRTDLSDKSGTVVEVIKEAQSRTDPTLGGSSTGIKIVDHDEIQKQVKESLQSEQQQRRAAANKARLQRKEENLTRVLFLLRNKPAITNDEVRDYLHVSQSTATNYLAELVRRGSIKREGTRGGARYSL